MEALFVSVEEEDWFRKPLIILVVPGLCDVALMKSFPAIYAFLRAKSKTGFEIWVLDTKEISTESLRNEILPTYAQIDDSAFLECCTYKHMHRLDDWRTLTQILQHTSIPNQNVLIWLTDSQQNHLLAETIYMANKRITPSIFQGWTRVIIEPPAFQKASISWDEEEHVFRFHPLVASNACQQLWSFRLRAWTRSLWNKTSVESVYIQVRSTSSPCTMLPQVYHVLSNIIMELPPMEERLSFPKARALSLCQISPYCRSIDLLTGKRTRQNGGEEPIDLTYVCVRCWVQSSTWEKVPFFLEISEHDAPRDDISIRLQLRDSSHEDAIEFGDKGAHFVMASLVRKTTSSHLLKLNMMGDHEDILDGRKRLFLDALRGEKLMFCHKMELDAIHNIVDPLIRQCKNTRVDPYEAIEGPARRLSFLQDITPPTSIN